MRFVLVRLSYFGAVKSPGSWPFKKHHTMRKLKSCGVLVVRGDPVAQFLLMVHPNRLDLPKGHVDAGESEIQCALRELVEETSITQEDIQLDPDFCFTTHYTVRPLRFGGQECVKTVVIFLGYLIRDLEIRPTEHEGYRWTDWRPPHQIQAETIDPLLSELERFLARR